MDVNDTSPSTSQFASDSTWSSFKEHVNQIVNKLQSASFDSDNEKKPVDLFFLFDVDDDAHECCDSSANESSQFNGEGFSDSVEYHDDETLLEDFQTLLSDPMPNDTSIVTSDELRLPLPSQVLRARSRYFHAMLSTRWTTTSENCLQKPDTTSAVFSDVLEYLVTGGITLLEKPHREAQNVELFLLANHLLLPSLECVIATHIANTLTLISFQSYLSVCVFPSLSITEHETIQKPVIVPESLEYVFASYAIRHLEELCESLPRTWYYARSLWYLLSTHSISCEKEKLGDVNVKDDQLVSLLHSKLRYFIKYITKVAATVPLTTVVTRESHSTREAFTNLFVHVQSDDDLATQLRLLGLDPGEQHQCSTCMCSAPARKRFRFDTHLQSFPADFILSNVQYFESAHPHTSPSDLFDSLQEVTVRVTNWKPCVPVISVEQNTPNSFATQSIVATSGGLECFDKGDDGPVFTIILFDRYSSLGPNAQLTFFRDNPTSPSQHDYCTEIVSLENVPPTYIALPTTHFWFGFLRYVPPERPLVHNWWGWRFAVFPALKQHVHAMDVLFGQ